MMNSNGRRIAWAALLIVGGAVGPRAGLAQLPATRLDAVFPAGAAPGTELELTIFGIDLDDVVQLQFSHPGIAASRKMVDPGPFDQGKQPVENRFVVSVKPDVPVGHHTVRALGRYGLSNPRTFIVHAWPTALEKEPNNDRAEAQEVQLPVTIDGQFANGADQDWYQFAGQAGQRLTIDGFGRRIDSRADLQMVLFAPDGRIVAASQPGWSKDPFIETSLPTAGVYRLRVRELFHGGGNEYPYRIAVGAGPIVAFVFPPAGLPGSNEEYTVYGLNLPGGQPSGLSSGGRPLEQLKVRIAIPGDILGRMAFSERLDAYQFALDGVEYRVAGPQGPSNPVLVTAATAAVVLEQENNSPQTAQKLVPPVEVAGQFYPQRDNDWYSFDAKAGDVYWIEVWSHRLGLPTDPTLVIQRVAREEDGKEQVTVVATVDDVDQRYGGREFDQRSYDPAYRFTAPADGTYRILVREGYSQLYNEPCLVYRLSIRKPEPDFRLVAVPMDVSGAILMRKGGREVVRVIAARRDGFDGPITISAAGLPAGVTAPEVTLGQAANFTSLILTADAGAAVGTGALQITGKSTVAGKELVRVARAGMSLDALQFAQPFGEIPSTRSRLVDFIPVSVSADEIARLQVTLGDGKVIETARGGVLKIPYTVTRQDGAAGTLTGFPIGLPPNIGLPQVPIGTNNAGDFELRLQANTPPGTYTFYLAGSAQGVNYSRNPESAAKAKERQDQLAKAVTETQQKLQAAQQAAQQAATALTTSTNEMATATQAKTTADQLAATTATAQKAAMEALAAATKLSAATPNDAALKEKVVAQQKEVAEATKKATTAADAAKVADTKLTEATTKQKLAQEAKQKADKDQQDAQALTQLAQQEKQRADQRAQQLQQQSAMRGYNVNFPSTPLTIKIAEYPVKASGTPDKLTVKQGAMLDLPFRVERLYGFAAEVTTQLVLPPGVAGLQAANVSLPANQADGKLVVMAQPNATPGVHNVIVRMTINFNGQGLTLDQTVALTVEKVEPAAK